MVYKMRSCQDVLAMRYSCIYVGVIHIAIYQHEDTSRCKNKELTQTLSQTLPDDDPSTARLPDLFTPFWAQQLDYSICFYLKFVTITNISHKQLNHYTCSALYNYIDPEKLALVLLTPPPPPPTHDRMTL